MAVPRNILIDLCHEAATVEFGLSIQATNINSLKNQIYAALAAIGESVEDIGILLCVPSIEGHLFIVKRSVELEI